MARPTRRRGKAPPPPVSQREKEVDLDVFEAEDSDPEEDRLQNKYDVRGWAACVGHDCPAGRGLVCWA